MEDEITRLRADVMTTLRACLMSTKGGVPLEHVNKDYRSLEGENIPYRKLGYSSIEKFIEQVPRIRQYRRAGVVFLEVVPDESTAHLAELISKQKSSKKKPLRMSMSRRPVINDRYNGINRRSGPRYNNYSRPQPQSPKRSSAPQRHVANCQNQIKQPLGNSTVTYPATRSTVTTYPAKPVVKSKPTVTTYPAKPVVKAQPTVTIYPPKSVVNAEPKVTIHPAKPVVKSEPPATIYPATPVVKADAAVITPPPTSSPRGEQIPVITRMAQNRAEYHQRPQVVQNHQSHQQGWSYPTPGYNCVNGNFMRPISPPQTPVFQSYNNNVGQMVTSSKTPISPTGNQFREVKHSMPPLSIANATRRVPPPLMVARPLSERLRRSSPDPQQPEAVVQQKMTDTINTEEKSRGYPSALTPPPEIEDPREELRLLAKRLGIPEPEYKHLRRTIEKGGKITVFTKVHVGSKHKYSSYPFDADNEVEAGKIAASSALNALRRIYGPPIKMRVTTDKELIQQRLFAIIDVHSSGVFMDQLPVYYKEMHNETLPDDWVNVVKQCKELSLDEGVEKKQIVRRCIPDVQRFQMKTPPLSPHEEKCLFRPINDTTPVPLILPTTDLWPVYVSQVFATSEVWIRLLEDEYNEKFFTMSQQLTTHYSTITEPSPTVEILNHYVTKINDEAHRVRVETLNPLTGDAEIFFIDSGDNDIVDCSKLFPLDKSFLQVPPQAIRACLSSLEEIAVCDTVAKVVDKNLLDKTFYAQVLNRDEDELSHVIVGIFYDTVSEIDVNVNERISLELHQVMESSKPDTQVAIRGRVLEVFVSHIEQNGDVYLQVKNDGMEILTSMLNTMLESCIEDEKVIAKATVVNVKELDPLEIYLTQKSDNSWVRVQLPLPRCNDSQMRMIDYGGLIDVDFSKLLRLRELSDSLARFPAQAVKVELHTIDRRFTERMETRLRELAGPAELLLSKIVQIPVFGRSAVVELFKRSQPDNLLISINNTLHLETELSKCEDGNNNVRKKRLERRGSRSSDDSVKTLKQPKILVEDFFNVQTTDLATSPDNFVVQPFDDKPKLEAMVKALQEAYKTNGPKLTLDELERGKVYAVKNYDGYWYRAWINQVFDEKSVAVHLCDIGNMCIVPLSQIQPLKKEFFDLPYQAIKARLVGIQPINGDWSLQTCVRFQKLVVNKSFVSAIKQLEHDDSTPSNIRLGLELIDTSLPDKDIYIHKVLINEGRALPEAK